MMSLHDCSLWSQYAASGDDSIILNAASPNGAREMFRGEGNNAATLAAIQAGRLDISAIESDGVTNEEDTIVRFLGKLG